MKAHLLKAAIAVAALAVPFAVQAGPGDWAFVRLIDTPVIPGGSAPTIGVQRLTADSTGKVYLSINNAAPNIYIYTCDDVHVTTPSFTMLFQGATIANGFQGLVVDESDNFYVAGESGAAGTGTLTKYDSTGNLVSAFGTAGVVTPTNRLTGLDMFSNGDLIATTFGGNFYTYDAADGSETEVANANAAGNFVRDLAVKQDSIAGDDVIFLNKSGDLKIVTGGSASNPTSYTLVNDHGTGIVNADTSWQVRAGVEYFDKDDVAIYTNMTDHKVYVVNASTGALVQELTGFYQPSDVAIWSEGGTDYMVIAHALGSLSVWSKTDVAKVEDWTLFGN